MGQTVVTYDQQYGTVVTPLGREKMAQALATNNKLDATHIAFGDGGGSEYFPTEDMTDIKNEVHITEVSRLYIDPGMPNCVVVEARVASDTGGWEIREAALRTAGGETVAIASLPTHPKPVITTGAVFDTAYRMIFQVSNAEAFEIKINPDIEEARLYIDLCIQAHNDDPDAHGAIIREIFKSIKEELHTTILTSGIIDTTLKRQDGVFVVDTTPFPTPHPQFITIRAKAQDNYAAGEALYLDDEPFPLITPSGKKLSTNAWVTDSVIEVTFDMGDKRAFFGGGGDGVGSGVAQEWGIFPGITPTEDSAPGLYIPDADTPTLILVDGHFVISEPNGGKVKKIATGDGCSFFLLEDGTVWSCGNNAKGQLGRVVATGSTSWSNLGQIEELENVKDVTCDAFSSTFFVLDDGTVWSCGRNEHGQLGRAVSDGSPSTSNLGQIEELSNVKKVVCDSYRSTFFLRNDGTVWSCGDNACGQLGRSVTDGGPSTSNIGPITALTNVKDISCGFSFTYFLLENGTVWSCGQNGLGRLGRVVATGSPSATNLGQVTGLASVKNVVCNTYSAYFLLENGTVWSCGDNSSGQLGRSVATGSETSSNLGQITELTNVKKVVSGLFSNDSCAYFLLNDGTVWSCGFNRDGQLGRIVDSSNGKSNLGRITDLTNIEDVICNPGTSYGSAFFLVGDGTVWSCGHNNTGHLGRIAASGTNSKSNLGLITSLANIEKVTCGIYHAAFQLKDKTAFSCGDNSSGELGRIVERGSPTSVNVGIIEQLPGDSGNQGVSIHENGTLMIQVDLNGSNTSFPIIGNGGISISLPILKVYQTKNNIDEELNFIIKTPAGTNHA